MKLLISHKSDNVCRFVDCFETWISKIKLLQVSGIIEFYDVSRGHFFKEDQNI